ncbi:response regulator receiver modulated diguanylate cyclase/phosphodiesterase with PAS/PAC sensor(s) [Magnetococcus marinus MC-1]|uniref:Response regulator receiver modulated diguanylate cyclase/phosphodiesterase with PAS/PAC sensor(S) n=1 Tax=Magnetococcus marinus (strain ATCC BAA-1437 / JCM 17883 / MC-1) TaxID=156889 RepID=A0L8P4_MAGMM|nr:GGDEF domain-containing response regulator [Magnetococcus marinus]ABK44337.1 response regulator receiver modulated diguanylate cyclase/phosphodiesterase with PAS/PAC sensor(s) [Magnetococcus marinus MC-1]
MKVLFVDDMATVRMLYGRLLSMAGYKVVLADSVNDALAKARIERPPLAIVDYHMPDGTGADLTRALLATPETSDILVVMHSQSLDVISESLEAGAIDLIHKEDPKEVFLMRVAAMGRFIETQNAHREAEAHARQKELQAAEQLRRIEEQARQQLEQRVRERTLELTQSNERLSNEVAVRMRAESGLRLIHKVFENTSEAIILTDPQGMILDINPAFTEITGFSREEALGHNPRSFKSDRHDATFYTNMWRKIAEEGFWQGEIWDRRKNGEIYPKRLTINAVRNQAGEVENYIGIFSDISESKATELKLERLAYYDALTQLPNRMLFHDRLEHEFYNAQRHRKQVAVFFIDLDRFKQVNDTLGHSAGDELLQHVAQRLEGCVRAADTVARMGGDEFTVILADISDNESVARVARKVLEELQKSISIKGHDIFVGASIGIALYPDNGNDVETLTKNADMAMYRAKESGRGNYKFFSEEMNVSTSQRLSLESQLHHAVNANLLEVYYQPKLNMQSGIMVGMEALVRWPQADGSMIPPIQFIPVAEETGLIVPLGRLVMRQAMLDCARWVRETGMNLRVAVNLSAREFQSPGLVVEIEQTLAECGLDARHFEVEITESLMMHDVENAIATLEQISRLGIHIAMDDFGTGYSSLSYLKKFPIHSLKVDRSFVKDIPDDPNDIEIVAAILSLAKVLNLKVVAEGVETQEQLSFLRQNLCDECQGYSFSKPLSAVDFTAFLADVHNHSARLMNNDFEVMLS